MTYSASSRLLLVITAFVVGGSLMVNPFLILGLSATLMSSTQASAAFLLALVMASAAAYLLTQRMTPVAMPRWLFVTALLLCAAMSGLLVALACPRALGCAVAACCLLAYRFANALSLVLSRSLHIATNRNASDTAPLFARVGAVSGVASAAGPALGGIVYERAGFRLLVMVAAGVFLCALAPAIWLLRTAPCELAPALAMESAAPDYGVSMLDLIGSTLTWALVGQSFSFVPLLLAGRAHAAWIAAFFTWKAVVVAVSSGAVLHGMRKFLPTSDAAQISAAILLLTTALLVFCAAPTQPVPFAAAILMFGMAEALFQPVLLERVRRRAGPGGAVRAIGKVSLVAVAIGAGGGQYLGSVANAILPLAWTAVCFALVGATAALCFLLAPSSPGRAPANP